VKTTLAKVLAVLAALALAITGCTKPGGGGSATMSVPADPPAALAVVSVQPQTDRGAVAALVAGSARTDEELEVVSGSGTVFGSGAAPKPPVIGSPAPPPVLPAHPTDFQSKSHQRQEDTYTAALTADRQTLTRRLTRGFSAWAATETAAMTRAGTERGAGPEAGLSAATTFFSSLAEAGVNLGPRRVLVVFGAPHSPAGLTPAGLSGVSVILAGFQGTLRAQQEWQAALLQAGAARATVLVPAAASQLAQVTGQDLAGQSAPAAADVYFGLNQSSLVPAAQLTLRGVARELTTSYPGATVTVLGLADPLGGAENNAHLSANRALAAEKYLIAQGVAPARITAAGYGNDLPAAPSQPDGGQPLDRRVIIVINPVAD
jgi:outer membrane protein OmpA-like peptidoglycan-associated protein